MIHSSRHRNRKVKVIAEMLAIMVESQTHHIAHDSRSKPKDDEWACASEFCAALDRYRASVKQNEARRIL